jgi:hypothetical protein
VDGDTLIIKNQNSCNFVRRYGIPINVYVSVIELKDLYLYGYGTINSIDTLTLDSLRIFGWGATSEINLTLNANHVGFHHSTGSINLNIKGNTHSCFIYSAGFAIGDVSELLSINTYVTSLGTGDFKVHASQSLSVEISSFGNVYYKGSPIQIDTVILGSGKLIKIN